MPGLNVRTRTLSSVSLRDVLSEKAAVDCNLYRKWRCHCVHGQGKGDRTVQQNSEGFVIPAKQYFFIQCPESELMIRF